MQTRETVHRGGRANISLTVSAHNNLSKLERTMTTGCSCRLYAVSNVTDRLLDGRAFVSRYGARRGLGHAPARRETTSVRSLRVSRAHAASGPNGGSATFFKCLHLSGRCAKQRYHHNMVDTCEEGQNQFSPDRLESDPPLIRTFSGSVARLFSRGDGDVGWRGLVTCGRVSSWVDVRERMKKGRQDDMHWRR